MLITNIKECGANNILKWAIQNNADIKNDIQIQSLINAETFYQITIEQVNYFELFRLTQTFRDQVHIVSEKQAVIPSKDIFDEYFTTDEVAGKDDEKSSCSEIAKFSADAFMNLVYQMKSDDDIIRSEAVRLFIPMIARNYTIQLPVSFMDLISFIPEKDFGKIYNNTYPTNLVHEIIESEDKNVINGLYIMLVRYTTCINYHEHYESLLKVIKYSPLKRVNTNALYKFALIGFYKYDNVSRSEVRCDLFKPDKEAIENTIKQLSRLNTPLNVEFVVELPIEYMTIIANYFNNDELRISYESSKRSIIEETLRCVDFITQEFDDPDEEKIAEYQNSVSTYKTRISEADGTLMDVINILTSHGVPDTQILSLLPSIYRTKAVFTLNMDYANLYINHFDALVVDMFQQMLDIGSSIIKDE